MDKVIKGIVSGHEVVYESEMELICNCMTNHLNPDTTV